MTSDGELRLGDEVDGRVYREERIKERQIELGLKKCKNGRGILVFLPDIAEGKLFYITFKA
ncbi:uncharacterized protein G2W53_041312 [Senna tora]|uniref:Uncharacterized protein n=1 Tax=Senna tora TaxID=362788 RepID=A0A834SEW4_9FABA|nr:uncharacterized protein G2W53_041312 [Senna tora]